MTAGNHFVQKKMCTVSTGCDHMTTTTHPVQHRPLGLSCSLAEGSTDKVSPSCIVGDVGTRKKNVANKNRFFFRFYCIDFYTHSNFYTAHHETAFSVETDEAKTELCEQLEAVQRKVGKGIQTFFETRII